MDHMDKKSRGLLSFLAVAIAALFSPKARASDIPNKPEGQTIESLVKSSPFFQEDVVGLDTDSGGRCTRGKRVEL